MVDQVRNGRKSSAPPAQITAGRGASLSSKALAKLRACVAIISNQGIIIYANPRFIKFFVGQAVPDRSVLENPILTKLLKAIASKEDKEPSDLLLVRNLNIVFDNITIAGPNRRPVNLSGQFVRIGRNRIICLSNVSEKSDATPSVRTADEQILMEAGTYAFAALHTFKGPVNTVRLLAALAKKSSGPEEVARKCDAIERECDSLLMTVNETFALSSGRADFKTIDLAQLFKELIESRKVLTTEHNIQLNLSGSCPAIEGVEGGLRNALSSIIDNAIHAVRDSGQQDKKVEIHVTGDSVAGRVSILIQDNGPGIPRDVRPQIFDPFFTTKKGGSGMGLPTAKKIIQEIHGGHISLFSRHDEGTVFTVILPYKPLTAQPPQLHDLSKKIDEVKRLVEPESLEFFDQCLEFVTQAHLRESPVEELVGQINGQVDRLNEYQLTGRLHLSANNFSRRTEVVISGDDLSVASDFWEKSIRFELQRLGFGEATIMPTRAIKKNNDVCRIFEIRKRDGQKLTEAEKDRLEVALRERLIPFPTQEELNAQAAFLRGTYALLKQSGLVLSAVFNPTVVGQGYRLVGLKLMFHPPAPQSEDFLVEKYLTEQPRPASILRPIMEKLSSPLDIVAISETIDPEKLTNIGVDDFTIKMLLASGYKSAILAVLPTLAGGRVANILCSSLPLIPHEKESGFLAYNHEWLTLLKSKL
ncbi:MAG: HAMP domain-containing sensor histidine kinase [Candidatus Margulisbacteria bacterium]|nr:HAMP domain-containing sensor histidine kinase [Candidatus Margulisiibacteriota bacterium]